MKARVRQAEIAPAPLVVLLQAEESGDLGARDNARAFPVDNEHVDRLFTKGPSIYDVRKIVGFFDTPPLYTFGTDLQY